MRVLIPVLLMGIVLLSASTAVYGSTGFMVGFTGASDEVINLIVYSDGSFKPVLYDKCVDCSTKFDVHGKVSDGGEYILAGSITSPSNYTAFSGRTDFQFTISKSSGNTYVGKLHFQYSSNNGSILVDINNIKVTNSSGTYEVYLKGKITASGDYLSDVRNFMGNLTMYKVFLSSLNITFKKFVVKNSSNSYTLEIDVVLPGKTAVKSFDSVGSMVGSTGIPPIGKITPVSSIELKLLSISGTSDGSNFVFKFTVEGKGKNGKLIVPLKSLRKDYVIPDSLANLSVELLPSTMKVESRDNGVVVTELPRMKIVGVDDPEKVLDALSLFGGNETVTLTPGDQYISFTPQKTTISGLRSVVVTIHTPVKTSSPFELKSTGEKRSSGGLSTSEIGITSAIALAVLAGVGYMLSKK